MADNADFLSFRTNSAFMQACEAFSVLQTALRELGDGRTAKHHHDFWQMELILQGACQVTLGKQTHLLNTLYGVLIPPGQSHTFIYDKGDCQFLTTKFTWHKSSFPDEQQQVFPFPLSMGQHLASLHHLCARHPEKIPGYAAALMSVLCMHMPLEQTQDDISPFVKRVRTEILRRQGKSIHIEDIATAINMSPKHMSSRYSKEAGETVKQRIDATRCELAKRLLRYEEDSVSEIAVLLGFPDVFSFSRFFYRMTGVRPKLFRQSGMQTGGTL